MSEYQCYEFRAIDRALSLADKQEIKSISTRAQITDRSFVNHDEFGDVTDAPWEFMARWVDLQLSFANWGTGRLMIRLPRQSVPQDVLDSHHGIPHHQRPSHPIDHPAGRMDRGRQLDNR